MSRTKCDRRFEIGAIAVIIGLAPMVGACGQDGASQARALDSTASSTSPSDPKSDQLPPEVEARLARNGTTLSLSTFDSGSTATEVLQAFYKLYDKSMFDSEPRVYAVTVVRSDESALTPQREVRVVLVADYMLDAPAPAPSPGGDAQAIPRIKTDMVAFFDAKDTSHLVTSYVGQQ